VNNKLILCCGGLAALAALTGPILGGCAPEELGPEPLPFPAAGPKDAPDPSLLGPYPVGVRTASFVDDTRTGPGGVGGRRLVTEVWYPAAESARGAPGTDYVLFDSIREDVRGTLQPQDLGTLQTIASRDAAPRLRERFPLILFSHGKGGIRMQSTFYTVLLASHGYVVVAPDHEGDTINDLLADGDVEVGSTAQHYIDRPVDLIFLMNELGRLRSDDALLGDVLPLIDFGAVGVTGHSFGALTSMITAGQDARVKVVVAQAPAGITLVQAQLPMPLKEIGKPVLIQSARMDRILEEENNARSVWRNMASPRAWLSLHRAGHFTYSDLCIFDIAAIDAALDIDASNVLEDGCGPENVPPDIAFPLINSAAVGFFNLHLRASEPSRAFVSQAAQDFLAENETTFIVE
jgi:dienelactone hydrolase